MKRKESFAPASKKLTILLTNGRFPVSIDLARQLHKAGHRVIVVDPMHYHVCRFSRAVKKSYFVPAPHVDAKGYVEGVANAVSECQVDLIIPLHEEIFYLAECNNPIIKDILFAPPFEVLIRLHNKWEFSRWLQGIDLKTPVAVLCKSREDVNKLDRSREWAVKPVYGRAAANVYHIKPSGDIPHISDISEEIHYIAQEWHYGKRYCSYSVIRKGKLQALGVYPVETTLDGSSCVYFEAVTNDKITEYHRKLATVLSDVSGQVALDFIEDEKTGEVMAIECNPRATSGIHLYSGTTHLARIFSDDQATHPPLNMPKTGSRRQVAPGMLMWEHKNAGPKQYFEHMKRLMGSRDVVFSLSDPGPSLMQPFLLTSYYEICRERHMKLPEMFQWDVCWEPQGEQLRAVREMLDRQNERVGLSPDVVRDGTRVTQEDGKPAVNAARDDADSGIVADSK